MFWTHWNLSALRSFYGLAASASQTEYTYINQRIHFFVFLFLMKKIRVGMYHQPSVDF
jgi:hypothetical protein